MHDFNHIFFDVRAEGGAELMARFLAELVRQGVTFVTEQHGGSYKVIFTGGF